LSLISRPTLKGVVFTNCLRKLHLIGVYVQGTTSTVPTHDAKGYTWLINSIRELDAVWSEWRSLPWLCD